MSTGLAPERLGRLRVLATDGELLYAASGSELYLSFDGGESFRLRTRAPRSLTQHVLGASTYGARFFRTGLHSLLPRRDGSLLATRRGELLRCGIAAHRFERVLRFEHGTRPLNLCEAPSGAVYFGEYYRNSRRREVHVYGTYDGLEYEVVHTFPAGSIRHVHSIHADPLRGGLWVLTGDEGREVGLWWTADEFRTLEPVLRGEQRARAVALLAGPDGLVLPMDSPSEQNWVQLFEPESGELTRLQPLPGSVFFACRTPRLWVLSTAVEKSRVNTDQRAALYASRDGLEWRALARFDRDLPWLRDRRGYLQYPTLALPAGRSAVPYVLASGQALSGAHDRLLRWSEEDVLAALRRGEARGRRRAA